MVDTTHTPGASSLTAREREIVALVGQGYWSWQIAERLKVQEDLIIEDVQTILRKLGLRNRRQLWEYATSRLAPKQRDED